MLLSRPQIGIVGKPNTGKTTFFSAATLKEAKISPTPFTTIDPNVGVGFVRRGNLCAELKLQCNPRSYTIIDNAMFIPVELIDVAGLVPDAWRGRGLGNQFLDHVRRAPVLIHVVDAAGSTDEEGRMVRPGTHDPVKDVEFLERELAMWMGQIMRRDWERTARQVEYAKRDIREVLYERLSGLGIKSACIEKALEELGLDRTRPSSWSAEGIAELSKYLLSCSKPIVIAANKMDIPEAEDGLRSLRRHFPDRKIVPMSADYELALRRASARGLIDYTPGDSDFRELAEILPHLKKALDRIRDYLKKWGSTGVVQALNTAIFDALNYVVVFPVEDERRLCDKEGNVLPDALLVPSDMTVRDVAYMIHSDLGEKFVSAIDVRSGKRLSASSKVYDGLVLKILARA